jgi:hypothetical protein
MVALRLGHAPWTLLPEHFSAGAFQKQKFMRSRAHMPISHYRVAVRALTFLFLTFVIRVYYIHLSRELRLSRTTFCGDILWYRSIEALDPVARSDDTCLCEANSL